MPALAAALLAACSAGLSDPSPSGSAGYPGFGDLCGSRAAAGDAGSTGGAGGANGGVSGAASGSGGTAALPPTCASGRGEVAFGVCFVNDADVLPPPPAYDDAGNSTDGPTLATIVAAGTGSAPAGCESARWYGARGASQWWFQARAADNRLWTIGVRGLGAAPLVRKDDTVILDHFWRGYFPALALVYTHGRLQLADASGAPLLRVAVGVGSAATDWLTWAYDEEDRCQFMMADCPWIRSAVRITLNGSVATLAPYGSVCLGGYYVAIGDPVSLLQPPSMYCTPDSPAGPPFDLAAVKLP